MEVADRTGIAIAILLELLGVTREAGPRDIEAQFGSVENYALNALALSPSILTELRDRLLKAA